MILKVQLLKGHSINVVQVSYFVPEEFADEFFKQLHLHIKKQTDHLMVKRDRNRLKEKNEKA